MVPDILKPDLIALGVNILAAWSPVGRASVYSEDTRSVKYYVDSGTTMSCPHVTGAAAIVKAAYPPYVVDPKKHENEREFAYGSGLLNPTKAVDPGLVFDASEKFYVDFLCKQSYNTTTVRKLTGDKSVCRGIKPARAWDLNYPSFSLAVEDGHEIKGNFHRTVTNVGEPNSTYNVSIVMPDSIKVNVEPSVLSFTDVGEKKSFRVDVNGPHITQVPIISGSITWKNGNHVVKSPLVIYNVLPLYSLPIRYIAHRDYPPIRHIYHQAREVLSYLTKIRIVKEKKNKPISPRGGAEDLVLWFYHLLM
ncbi:PREDICTED: cucumisin-like [Prunus mume]|uniref:Cucumisin-like n=1 Tax=Prunus mume TaxID=102107 RepID=A0ABM1LQX8_PRUMU|nr:PREDICTED: cucumisin-like [Prunus mume]